jgi:phosphoglycerate kinase
MEKKSIREIDVKGKKVLVRVDFNVPIDEQTGEITDVSRIKASLPTIQYLVNHQSRVILLSHLGRPDGKPVSKFSLKQIVPEASRIIGYPVGFVKDCIGPEAEKAVADLNNGEILLLENVRFYAEEEKNDPEFARSLSKLADIFVQDAFGTAHRKHASIVGITRYLPAVAGLLLEKEIMTLGGLVTNPQHPFAAVLGGAKVSDKIALMENIMDKVDVLLVGGGMAATFLKSKGYEIGQSLFEADRVETTRNLVSKAAAKKTRLVLPVDVVVTNEANEKGTRDIVPVDRIPKDKKLVDIGPKTIELFKSELEKCRTVFWNGPMGIFEIAQFAQGTETMVKLLATIKASTIIGGGSTAEIVTNMGFADKMTFVSTGGGASMSFLSGEKLPGVESLSNK